MTEHLNTKRERTDHMHALAEACEDKDNKATYKCILKTSKRAMAQGDDHKPMSLIDCFHSSMRLSRL